MIKVFFSMCLMLFGLLLSVSTRRAQSDATPSLKEVFKSDFLIGAALNRRQFSAEDTLGVSIITAQFNTVTPENILKWEAVHPRPETYDFAGSDRYVAFGEKYQMVVIGHTLGWHNQTPQWVFHDGKGNSTDRETLLQRMREHIHTLVGRYKGRIKGWDVVNEALNEDGTMRQSQWMKIIGDDYIAKAFEFAHEADPQAEVYYNDYDLENEPKRNGAVRLIKTLKAQGVPIAGIGLLIAQRFIAGTRRFLALQSEKRTAESAGVIKAQGRPLFSRPLRELAFMSILIPAVKRLCQNSDRCVMRSVPPRGSGWVSTLPIVDFRFPIDVLASRSIDNRQLNVGNVETHPLREVVLTSSPLWSSFDTASELLGYCQSSALRTGRITR